MLFVEKTDIGDITISENVIQTIAGFVATGCYGVVGMVSVDMKSGILQLLSRDSIKKGVKVSYNNQVLTVDMFIVIEMGINIGTVATNLQKEVMYTIKSMTGINTCRVNVNVQGVRVQKDELANPKKN